MDNAVLMIAKEAPKEKSNWRMLDHSSKAFRDIKKEIKKGKLKQSTWLMTSKPKKCRKKLFASYEKIEAAGGLVRNNDRFLFIERHGLWDIPKGKIEKNESPTKAAVREIKEECGVDVSLPSAPMIITWHTYSIKKKQVLKKTYWYTHDLIGSEVTKVQVEENITKAVWLKPSKLNKVLSKTYDSIIDVIKADSRIHLQ